MIFHLNFFADVQWLVSLPEELFIRLFVLLWRCLTCPSARSDLTHICIRNASYSSLGLLIKIAWWLKAYVWSFVSCLWLSWQARGRSHKRWWMCRLLLHHLSIEIGTCFSWFVLGALEVLRRQFHIRAHIICVEVDKILDSVQGEQGVALVQLLLIHSCFEQSLLL